MISSTSNHENFSSRRSSRPEVLYKKAFLSNFKYFTIKHLCRSLFLNKFASLILLIKILAQVVVCKFCNIFKSTSFVKQIRPAASEHSQNHQVSDTVTWKWDFLWLIFTFHEENQCKKNQPSKQFLAHNDQ